MTSKGAQFTLIANVPYDTVRQDLVSEFRRFGRVELAMVVCDEASRHPHKEWTSTAGYAFVRFSKRSEAAAAIQAAGMGLVTIRGVRVRADWARKDSYAKRGRVSPQQGAPLMGTMGVPDGIQALHTSLMSRGLPQETSPVWVASQLQKSSSTWGAEYFGPTTTATPPSSTSKSPYATSSSSSSASNGSEDAAYAAGVLSDPTTSAGGTDELSVSPISINSMKLPSLDSKQNFTSAPPSEDGGSTQLQTPQYDALYAQLATLIANKVSEANASSSTTGSLTPKSPRPPPSSPFTDGVESSGATTAEYLSPTLPGIDDMLSPCSRGLLEQALSDVVYTKLRDSSPAAEFTCLASRSSSSARKSRPEDLLHAAVKCCDLAGIHL